MILGMEIALAIVGLMALVRGKMTLSKTKVVVGAPARLLGLIALTPLPLALGAVLLYVSMQGEVGEDDHWVLIAIEAGVVIGVAILVFGIGAAVAVPTEEAERRERGTAYDDFDDEPDDRDRDDRRDEKRRRDDYDDDADDRGRGNRSRNRDW